MSINDGSASTHQFVASPGYMGMGTNYSAKRTSLMMYGGLAAFIGLIILTQVVGMQNPTPLIGGVVLVALVGSIAYFAWAYLVKAKGEIIVGVTADGLTVNQRRGDVFAFGELKLGLWAYDEATTGSALHLRRGSHRFVLGGRDHRLGRATRLDEPPVPGVDAWLWGADFDALLSMVGPRSGLDVRGPAPDEPVRCLLFPNPLLVQEMGSFAIGKMQEFTKSATKASLAIDVTADGIQVIEPSGNPLSALFSPAQVTATPIVYRPTMRHYVPTAENVAIDAAFDFFSMMPGMVVNLPGGPPLTIGCRDAGESGGLKSRFSWRGDVPVHDGRSDYVVMGAGLADPGRETRPLTVSGDPRTLAGSAIGGQSWSRCRHVHAVSG